MKKWALLVKKDNPNDIIAICRDKNSLFKRQLKTRDILDRFTSDKLDTDYIYRMNKYGKLVLEL